MASANLTINVRCHKRWTYWPLFWCFWVWVRLRLPIPWRLLARFMVKTIRVEVVK